MELTNKEKKIAEKFQYYDKHRKFPNNKMKRDKFYLVVGILEMLVGILVFFRTSHTYGIIIFLLGILILVKDYLRLINFSLIDLWRRK